MMNTAKTAGSQRARVAVSWALVGLPLAYGVFETFKKAAQLFTG